MIGDIYEAKYSDKNGVFFHYVGIVIEDDGIYLTLKTVYCNIADDAYKDIWTMEKYNNTPEHGVTFLGTKKENPEYFL